MLGRGLAWAGFAGIVLAATIPVVRLAAAPAAPAATGSPTPSDLDRLSLRALEIEAALPLARRGRIFRTVWLDAYFRRQPWYRPTGFDPRDLPPAERARVDTLVGYQKARSTADLERRRQALMEQKGRARAACPQDVVAAGPAPGAASNQPQRVVVVDPARGLTVFDSATGSSRRIVPQIVEPMTARRPALSRDGARVLAVEGIRPIGETISAWDAGTGQSLGKPLLQTHDMGTVYDLLPGGTTALVQKMMDPRSWELWSIDEKRSLLALPHGEISWAVDRVALSTDGRRLLASAMGRLWLWQVKTPAPGGGPASADGPLALTDEYDTTRDGDLSPDGRWVAHLGSSWSAPRLWEVDRPTAKKKLLETPEGDWRFLRFSPDGRRVMAGSQAHDLAIWDVADGRVVWSRAGAPPSLECAGVWAAFFPDGRMVAIVDDGGGLDILDMATGKLRSVAGGAAIASRQDDEIEEQLIGRALGQKDSAEYLRELSFDDHPALFEQRITEEEVLAFAKDGYDPRQLEALIYARRGRAFASPGWRAYVEERSWYRADPGYGDSMLTPIDRDNLAQVARVRQGLKPRPPAPKPDPAAMVPHSAFPACPTGARRVESTLESESSIQCVKIGAGGRDIRHGPLWIWRPTGRLGTKISFVDDKAQGSSVTWYWSGARKEEGEMVGGKRQGRWREFFPSGRMAEEAVYEDGKLHGSRRRLFDTGKPALEARYEHGAPVGAWTAYYDNGRPAMKLTFPGGTGERFLPSGEPWPKGEKLESCAGRLKCASRLEQMDFDSLPPAITGACPHGDPKWRAWSRGAWKPLLAGARRIWTEAEGNEYSPRSCVESVAVSCAPDLDGDGGDEVLATISYRILLNGEQRCHAKDSNGYWDMTALVALSPPAAGASEWVPKGLVGYPRFTADNGGAETEVTGFVRLPSGEVGLRVDRTLGGGDCDREESRGILVLRGREWEPVFDQTIVACGEPVEPEERDVY